MDCNLIRKSPVSAHPGSNSNGRTIARERPGVRALVRAGFQYAFSLTHHRHDAEDLVQQASLQVIRATGGITSKTYLFVAIRNLFYDAGRRKALASFGPLNDEFTLAVISEDDRIGNKLDVELVLATLSVEARELMYLNCIEGFTAQEIADLTDRPRSTVLSQLARTKKKLREHFRVGAAQRALP